MLVKANITGKGSNGEPLYTVNLNNAITINHLSWNETVNIIHEYISSLSDEKEIYV